MLDTLRTHIDYTTWASAKLLEAAAALTPEELTRDFGASEHSVVGTMGHIFAADRIWLHRVQGVSPVPFIDPSERDLAVLQSEWPKILEAWRNLAAAWTEESLSDSISYKQMNGQPFSTPIWQTVLHMVNHATHHRGQAVGFIRAMGHQPPKLDLIFYYREQDAQKAATA